MSALFDGGRQRFLEGSIAYLTDTIKIMFIDQSIYNPNVSTDNFFSDITSTARIGNSSGHTRADMPTLAGKTSTAGVADANDVTFTTVAAGSALASLVIFKDTGADGTSPLIAKIDSGTGLPVTPNGGDITVAFDNGANRIFKLRQALAALMGDQLVGVRVRGEGVPERRWVRRPGGIFVPAFA